MIDLPVLQIITLASAKVQADSFGNLKAHLPELGGELYYNFSSRQLFLDKKNGNFPVLLTGNLEYNQAIVCQYVSALLSAMPGGGA